MNRFRISLTIAITIAITIASSLLGAQDQRPNAATADKPELVLQSGHSSVVTGVAFHPHGAGVASVSNDGTLKLWSFPEGNLLQTLDVREIWSRGLPSNSERQRSGGGLSTVAFMPDGKSLLTADWTGVISWRFGESNRYLRQSGIVEGGICSDPNGHWIAVASNSIVMILDPSNLHVLRSLEANSGSVLAIAVSPDGSQLVSGGVDKSLTIWDPLKGKKLKVLRGHTDYVRALAFSQDGQTLVSGSDDKTIGVWSTVTGMLKNTLVSNSGVQGVTLSPDGRFIASAGQNDEVSLWSNASGQVVQTWKTAGGERFTDFQDSRMHKAVWLSGGLAFSRRQSVPGDWQFGFGGNPGLEHNEFVFQIGWWESRYHRHQIQPGRAIPRGCEG